MFRLQHLKYVIPNLCTSFSLLLGLASVLQSIDGNHDLAAWMILWGVLLDKLDGTTARLLNASSEVGAQLDSFADFVSFGIAPAFLWYMYLQNSPFVHHGFLMTVCGVFVVAVAFRLARFNVSEPPGGKYFFFGIPTTLMGAFLSCGFLASQKLLGTSSLFFTEPLIGEEFFAIIPFVIFAGTFAMISSLRIPKLKIRRNLPLNIFQAANVLFAYIVGPFRLFPEVLFIQCSFYIIVGTIWAATSYRTVLESEEDLESLLDDETEEALSSTNTKF